MIYVGLPPVLEYSSTTQVVNYSSNFLLLEYSLICISGCKFPFPVAVFGRLQSIDKLLEFLETGGYAISFVTCQPVEIDQCTVHSGTVVVPLPESVAESMIDWLGVPSTKSLSIV